MAENAKVERNADIQTITAYPEHFTKHPERLLLEQPDPIQRANYFAVLFDEVPTYQELNIANENRIAAPGERDFCDVAGDTANYATSRGTRRLTRNLDAADKS